MHARPTIYANTLLCTSFLLLVAGEVEKYLSNLREVGITSYFVYRGYYKGVIHKTFFMFRSRTAVATIVNERINVFVFGRISKKI